MPTVLLVDDDEQTLSVLRRRLGTAGYQVIEARDAENALALCRDATPDVVVTDLRLPGQSGEEFIARLRQHHRALPVIAISGAPERLAALTPGGPTHVLPKPFTSQALNQVLADAFAPPPAPPAARPSLLQRLRRLLRL